MLATMGLTEHKAFVTLTVVPNLVYEKTRDKRIEEHRCVTCGSSKLATERLCERCRQNVLSAANSHRERLRAAGLCLLCGKVPAERDDNGEPMSGCRPCLDAYAERDALRRQERKSQGIKLVRKPRTVTPKSPKTIQPFPDWVNANVDRAERNAQIIRLRAMGFSGVRVANLCSVSKQYVWELVSKHKNSPKAA